MEGCAGQTEAKQKQLCSASAGLTGVGQATSSSHIALGRCIEEHGTSPAHGNTSHGESALCLGPSAIQT